MSLYPFNTNWGPRRAQSDAGVLTTLVSQVSYSPGSPLVADVDWYVVSANMKVGTYTLANAAPDVGARNVTVSHTAVGAADTLGTITVAGTNLAGAAISEVITPVSGTTVQGAKAFASVTSVTGAGWVISEGNDTITVGFGERLGLPDMLADTAQVLSASLNGVRQTTHPTVAVSAAVLESNTCDLSSALNGTPVTIYYLV